MSCCHKIGTHEVLDGTTLTIFIEDNVPTEIVLDFYISKQERANMSQQSEQKQEPFHRDIAMLRYST